jgi:hypothetical protein
VSERYPTYYDFCLADADRNTCCYSANNTFKGISHSGDNCSGNDLLQYVKIDKASFSATKEYCVFISGFRSTKITRFLGTNPALLVANHNDKVGCLVLLYAFKGHLLIFDHRSCTSYQSL